MRPLPAACVAGIAGFAVMSMELTAVRLLAPHFGDSAYVWTNVIGVMLVALALGAWLGGILGDQPQVAKRLAVIFVIAGCFAAIIPVIARPLGAWLLPLDLPLDAATPALIRGSLAATLILFAPPVLLAGMASPMLISMLTATYGKPGRASGLIGAVSTVGSLLGTFATTHILIPDLGSRMTAWICAALLVVCALVIGAGRRGVVALALVIGFASLSIGGPMRYPAEGVVLLEECESAYQYLQVLHQQPDGEREITSLKINEGLDSFHSVRLSGTPYTEGRYYDFHAVVPFLVGDGVSPDGLRVLSLGAAAGTFERVMAAAHPGVNMDSVEIDPAVVDLGRRHFSAFETGRGEVFSGLDARVYVERSTRSYEMIIVDAYERQVYIPAHVASTQFFAAVHRRLVDGGIVSVNAGGKNFDDPVVETLARTMASVFGRAHAFRIPQSRNFMVLARRGKPLNWSSLGSVKVDDDVLHNILTQAARPADWRSFAAAEPILDDDRPFLDKFQDRALVWRESTPILLEMDGSKDPAVVGREAHAQLKARSFALARDHLQQASHATAYLRFLAGDCRWNLRDETGALLEYRAANSLAPAPWLQPGLDDRLSGLEMRIQELDRAQGAAEANAWLASGAGCALLAVFLLLRRRFMLLARLTPSVPT